MHLRKLQKVWKFLVKGAGGVHEWGRCVHSEHKASNNSVCAIDWVPPAALDCGGVVDHYNPAQGYFDTCLISLLVPCWIF